MLIVLQEKKKVSLEIPVLQLSNRNHCNGGCGQPCHVDRPRLQPNIGYLREEHGLYFPLEPAVHWKEAGEWMHDEGSLEGLQLLDKARGTSRLSSLRFFKTGNPVAADTSVFLISLSPVIGVLEICECGLH